jgi:hypothetical protein
LLLSSLLAPALLPGQAGLATITGTISDPTGAVIAGAPVQVRNLATGQLFTAATTETGNYTVAQLPVGRYDLTVTFPGFKTYNRSGFSLAAQQTMREDIVLEIGSQTEAVTVTAEASLLKTESSELVHNVTVSQMNNLPVLPVGSTGAGFRDPFALTRMIPGTSYVAGTTMVINGVPDDTVQFRVEGLTAGNTGALRQFTQQTQASVDAIQEVAVQTSNYAAEYGTAGGGVLNVVMKSGTNQYHGSAYDYAVNEALNAYQPYTGLRNAQKRHDYGFTLGGPVRLPQLYDGRNRTFFFWNWEQYRENTLITSTAPTVPIPAYRAGDFSPLITVENNRPIRVANANYVDPLGRALLSGMIFDPATTRPAPSGTGTVRDQFPGNVIPASRFDPVSLKVLALVPLPKGINSERGQFGNNYQTPWRSKRTSEIPSLKIDQTIGSKGRLSGYWQQTTTSVQYAVGPAAGDGLPEPITQSRGTFITGYTYRLNYDHTLTPTVLLHFGAGWSGLDFSDRTATTNYDTFAQLGLRGATIVRHFPRLTVGSVSAAIGGMSALGPSPQAEQFERRPMGNVTVSWVRGNHTIKGGAEYRLEKFPTRTYTDATGNYTFGNSTQQTSLQGLNVQQGFHGFNFASFMLGDLSGATLARVSSPAPIKSQWAMYLQDNWKVTRRLTVDYGLRWDFGTYAKEQYGRNGNLDLLVPNASAGGHPGGYIYEATCQCRFADNYPYGIGPRLGMAYQINSRTVLRGGIGVVYNATDIAAGSSVNNANAGTPGFGLTVGRFQDGMPANVQPRWPNFDANAGHPNNAVVAAPAFLDPNAGRPARQLQWSLSLQRELTRNIVVEASYVANRGVWWTNSGQTPGAGTLAPINVLKVSDLTSRGFNNFTSLAESNLLTVPLQNLNAAQRATLAARGIHLPYAGFPQTLTARQSILPFPQYNTNISPVAAPLGNTWYDALQTSITHRFSHGLTMNANYTFAKNLDLMTSIDPFNRALGKNLSPNDIPHQFRMTAEYQTPSLRNRGWRFFSSRAVAYILEGWGVGWYLQYQSAGVLAPPANQGPVPISNFLGYGPGPAQLKMDPATGKPMSPWSVDWVDYSGKRRTDPIDINCHCFDPTKNIVLNPNAWENVPDGQFGAQQQSFRFFRGIRQPQESLNLARNFRFTERVLLHVRVEFQNAFNRMRLPQPVTAANFTALPTTFTSGAFTGLYSGGFGTILPTSGTTGQRAGTLIGRITF